MVLEASALHTASNLEMKYDILHCRENCPLFILAYVLFKPWPKYCVVLINNVGFEHIVWQQSL